LTRQNTAGRRASEKQLALIVKNQANDHVARLDSNDSGAERGITIFAKNGTSVCLEQHPYQHRRNTPGPPTLVGEVERSVGCRRVGPGFVDAAEGPMPTDQFVTSKALKLEPCALSLLNKSSQGRRRAVTAAGRML